MSTERIFTGPRDKTAFQEGTRDPIFLFQRREWVLTGVPDGYGVDDEGDVVPENMVEDSDRVGLPWTKLKELSCAVEHWLTELVFLSREEGEAFGRAKHYNYRDGWRVYCMPAEGTLKRLLKERGDEYLVREQIWPHQPAVQA